MSLSEKLISAAKTGDTKEVRKLLSRGALFSKDKFGNTALHEAAWNGNSDIVKLLLKSFCFVDSINSTGFTPLHLASQNGHAKVVKTLLKWQADPALLNEHGEAALHLAAKYDHASVITTLAGTKMDVNIRGKDENTALHIAAKLGNVESVKALIGKGANPYLRNEKGVLPGEYAESGGFSDVVKLLQAAAQKFKNSDCFLQSTQAGERDTSKPFMRSSSVSSPMVMRVNKEDATIKKHSYPLDIRLHAERYSSSPCPPEDMVTPTLPKRSASPNIEQLLTEIEQECHGPGYKFHPPSKSGSLSPPEGLSNNSTPRLPAKAFLKSAREGCPPAPKNYDTLEPRVPQLDPTPSPHTTPSHTTPPHTTSPHTTPPHTTPPHTIPLHKTMLRDKNHCHEENECSTGHLYESLSPRSPADKDGYVYMASLSEASDLQCNARANSNVRSTAGDLITSTMLRSGSNGGRRVRPRRAVICTSPVQLCTKHEPSSKTPTKGILAQPTSDGDAKSQVDRYLQEELETMRQAFQIRLAQLEKRYQRRLVMEQQRNSQHSNHKATTPQPQNYTGTLQRRRSWHGSHPDEEDAAMSNNSVSVGINKEVKRCLNGDVDSDIDSPLAAVDTNNELHPPKVKGGLKGGSSLWRERCGEEVKAPNLSPTRTLEDCSGLSEAAKMIINQRLHEYHAKMTRHFNEKAESKIAAIELEYQLQLCEIQRKCQTRSSQRMVRLGTRMKDLEGTPRAQTLV